MTNHRFNLEDRTFTFAKQLVLFCKDFPVNVSNIECRKQLIRSAGSIGANYIEANESLGKKDFLLHIRISRKEAKESVYWMRLLVETNPDTFRPRGNELMNEAIELKKIFSAIIEKTQP